jgi:hypothetical protein
MTPEQIITRQLSTWKVPRAYQELRLEDLHPSVLQAIPDSAISDALRGQFPASIGICGIARADRAFAALVRQSMESYITAHPEVLDDEDRPVKRQVLWISWTALFGELVMADAWSEEFKATASIFDRMENVKVLILTGLGDTPDKPERFEAAIKGVLTRRSSEGLRTYWESPLSLKELQARYGRTGIVTEAKHG